MTDLREMFEYYRNKNVNGQGEGRTSHATCSDSLSCVPFSILEFVLVQMLLLVKREYNRFWMQPESL